MSDAANVAMVQATPPKEKEKDRSSDDTSLGSLTGEMPTDPSLSYDKLKTITTWIFRRHSAALQSEVTQFFDQAGIDDWTILHGQGRDFIESAVNDGDMLKGSLKKMAYRGRLLQVLLYGRVPDSTPEANVMFEEAMADLKAYEATLSPHSSTTEISSTSSPDQELKLKIPDLPKYSGVASSYYGWHEQVTNLLTANALIKAIEDPTYHGKNPKTSTAVFGALATACGEGLARSHVQSIRKTKVLSAYALMQQLDGAYKTPLTQANFVIHALRQLIELKLDAHSTAASFVSEFREILNRMNDNGIDLSNIKIILRGPIWRYAKLGIIGEKR